MIRAVHQMVGSGPGAAESAPGAATMGPPPPPPSQLWHNPSINKAWEGDMRRDPGALWDSGAGAQQQQQQPQSAPHAGRSAPSSPTLRATPPGSPQLPQRLSMMQQQPQQQPPPPPPVPVPVPSAASSSQGYYNAGEAAADAFGAASHFAGGPEAEEDAGAAAAMTMHAGEQQAYYGQQQQQQQQQPPPPEFGSMTFGAAPAPLPMQGSPAASGHASYSSMRASPSLSTVRASPTLPPSTPQQQAALAFPSAFEFSGTSGGQASQRWGRAKAGKGS